VALLPVSSLGVADAVVSSTFRVLQSALGRVPHVAPLDRDKVTALLRAGAGGTLQTCQGDESCLARVARALEVQRVVTAEVGGVGRGVIVYLRAVAVASVSADGAEVVGQETGKASALLGGSESDNQRAAREAMVELLVPSEHVGRLDVTVNVAGATLQLDGATVANSPAAPLRVAVGTHALRVTHPEYQDFLKFVEIPFEGTVSLPVQLTHYGVVSEELAQQRSKGARVPRGPRPTTPAGPTELPLWRNPWVVMAAGVVVAAGITTLVATRTESIAADSVRPGP
jgi:hypothetical protein